MHASTATSSWAEAEVKNKNSDLGGISSSVLSVFFTDKFALSQSDARISVAYKICQWKTLTKHLMKCPPAWSVEDELEVEVLLCSNSRYSQQGVKSLKLKAALAQQGHLIINLAHNVTLHVLHLHASFCMKTNWCKVVISKFQQLEVYSLYCIFHLKM